MNIQSLYWAILSLISFLKKYKKSGNFFNFKFLKQGLIILLDVGKFEFKFSITNTPKMSSANFISYGKDKEDVNSVEENDKNGQSSLLEVFSRRRSSLAAKYEDQERLECYSQKDEEGDNTCNSSKLRALAIDGKHGMRSSANRDSHTSEKTSPKAINNSKNSSQNQPIQQNSGSHENSLIKTPEHSQQKSRIDSKPDSGSKPGIVEEKQTESCLSQDYESNIFNVMKHSIKEGIQDSLLTSSRKLTCSNDRFCNVIRYLELEESSNIFLEMDTFQSRNNSLKSVRKEKSQQKVFVVKRPDLPMIADIPIEEAYENEEESECLSNDFATRNIDLLTMSKLVSNIPSDYNNFESYRNFSTVGAITNDPNGESAEKNMFATHGGEILADTKVNDDTHQKPDANLTDSISKNDNIFNNEYIGSVTKELRDKTDNNSFQNGDNQLESASFKKNSQIGENNLNGSCSQDHEDSSLFDIIEKDVTLIERRMDKMDEYLVSGKKQCLDQKSQKELTSYKKKMKDDDVELIKKITSDNIEDANDNSLYNIIEKGMLIVENRIEVLDEKFLSKKKSSIYEIRRNTSGKNIKRISGSTDDMVSMGIQPLALNDNFNEVRNSVKKCEKENDIQLFHTFDKANYTDNMGDTNCDISPIEINEVMNLKKQMSCQKALEERRGGFTMPEPVDMDTNEENNDNSLYDLIIERGMNYIENKIEQMENDEFSKCSNKDELLGSLRNIFIEDIDSKEELPGFSGGAYMDSFNNTLNKQEMNAMSVESKHVQEKEEALGFSFNKNQNVTNRDQGNVLESEKKGFIGLGGGSSCLNSKEFEMFDAKVVDYETLYNTENMYSEGGVGGPTDGIQYNHNFDMNGNVARPETMNIFFKKDYNENYNELDNNYRYEENFEDENLEIEKIEENDEEIANNSGSKKNQLYDTDKIVFEQSRNNNGDDDIDNVASDFKSKENPQNLINNYRSPQIISLDDFSTKEKPVIYEEGSSLFSYSDPLIHQSKKSSSNTNIKDNNFADQQQQYQVEKDIKKSQLKKMIDENESLVEEYRKLELLFRTNIKENKSIKSKVLGTQKENKELRHACEEADEQIFSLQVKHDDLLEDFRKNLTMELNNNIQNQTGQFNSEHSGDRSTSEHQTESLLNNEKPGLGSAYNTNQFPYNTNSSNITNNNFISINNKHINNQYPGLGNFNGAIGVNPDFGGSAQDSNVTGDKQNISKKVFGSLNKTLFDFFQQSTERKAEVNSQGDVLDKGNNEHMSSEVRFKEASFDNFDKGVENESDQNNGSMYDIKIFDSKVSLSDINPCNENQKVDMHCEGDFGVEFCDMNMLKWSNKENINLQNSRNNGNCGNSGNIRGCEVLKDGGERDKGVFAKKKAVRDKKSVNQEKIMNAIRNRINNL